MPISGFKRAALIASVGLASLNVISGILAYFFQMFSARIFEPENYLAISTLLALVTTIGSPFGSYLLILSRDYSVSLFQQRKKLLTDNVRFYLGCLSLSSILLILSLSTTNLYNSLIPDFGWGHYFFVAAMFISLGLQNIFLAFFQASKRIILFGMVGFMTNVSKLGCLSVFYLLTPSFEIFLFLLGIMFILVMLINFYFFVSQNFKDSEIHKRFTWNMLKGIKLFSSRLPKKNELLVIASNAGVVVLTQFDIVLVNFMSENQADKISYTSASILAKSVFYVSIGVIQAFFPYIVDSSLENKSFMRSTFAPMALVVGAGCSALLIGTIWGDWILALVYGDEFGYSTRLFSWLLALMIPISAFLILEQSAIAFGLFEIGAIVWLINLLIIFGIVVMPFSVENLITSMGAGVLIGMVIGIVVLIRWTKDKGYKIAQ